LDLSEVVPKYLNCSHNTNSYHTTQFQVTIRQNQHGVTQTQCHDPATVCHTYPLTDDDSI